MRLLQGFLGRFFQVLCLFSSDLQQTTVSQLQHWSHVCRWEPHSAVQVDGVGVQVHADHVGRRVIKVKVARVNTHDEGKGGVENVSQ